MKRIMCNTEIIKLIKDLESQKQELIESEKRNCFAVYTVEEKSLADFTPYDLMVESEKIVNINNSIRYLKHTLNVANATVIVPEFKITIGECLVLMAMINQQMLRFKSLANTDKVVREKSYYGKADSEYKEVKYDIKVAKMLYDDAKENLKNLQMAIDRINLSNMIEVNY